MSWRVFYVPRLNRSVVGSVRNLTQTAGNLVFDGSPMIPALTLQAGNQATASDDTYDYTLKILHPNPLQATYFLGQFLKVRKSDPADYWYDTILAFDNNNILGPIANDSSPLTIEAPLAKLLKKTYAGSIDLTQKTILVETSTGSVTFPFNKSDNGYGMSNNGYPVNGKVRRFGATFTNYVQLDGSTRSILFGHFHWDEDFGIFVPGDKTEPFVAIQPPPPPHCDDSRATEGL